MEIRPFALADLPRVTAIWNDSVIKGEVVYYPLTAAYFEKKFLKDPNYMPQYSLVAVEDGRVIGFISGICKQIFLPKENAQNTPGYITCVFVDAEQRGRGVGTLLLNALEEAFRRAGKTKITCSGGNPVNLDWIVPGTPGHDHNNAPGMDEDCPGYEFLIRRGFEPKAHEIAMYLNLADYNEPPVVREKRAALSAQGIYTGRYDVTLGYDYNGMCDRVGSEYWRKVLKDEIAAKNPRPILVGTYEKSIVGFTGPVDKQASGRGWFTGICTDPLFEGRGIATVIFNLLMQEFIAEGATFSTLFTGVDNHAQKVYFGAGFRVARKFAVLSRDL